MANPPQPGEIVDGYRFKGGNPADQSSWENTATAANPQEAVAQSAVPKVGDVVDGYSFKGGNPADKNSWVRTYAPSEALESATKGSTWISSAGKRLEELGEAVSDPIGTISQIGKIAAELTPNNIINYAGQKLAAMLKGGDEAKAMNAEADKKMATVAPIFEEYANTYGSKENFWRMIAEDPTRLLSDLAGIATPFKSSLVSGATRGAAKVGAGTKAGAVGRAVGAIPENLDVSTAILNAGSKLADLGGKAFTSWGGVKTGVGGKAIREAAQAAALGGDHFDDFRRGMSGALSEDEMVARARTGTRNMRDKMMADYQAVHGTLPTTPIQVFGEIDQTVRNANDSLYKQYPSGQRDTILSPDDQRKWQNVLDTVERWRADPSRHTITGLDDLKQAVRNQLSWTDKNKNLQRAVTEVTDGILTSVKQHAPPEFGKMLEEYSQAYKQVDEIEKEFSLNKNRTPQQAMTKLQSILRNNVNTRYGSRVALADILEAEGGVRLKSGLAGMTFNTAEPRGLARMMIPGVTVAGGLAAGPVGAAIGYGADFLASNPKLWGYGAAGAGLGRRMTQTLPGRTVGSLFSPPGLQAQRIVGAQQQRDTEAQAGVPRFRGGRAGYAYGGSVKRLAIGGAPAEDSGMLGVLAGPYSGVGLGSVAQAARRQIASTRPSQAPQVRPPEVTPLKFAKPSNSEWSSLINQAVRTFGADDEKKLPTTPPINPDAGPVSAAGSTPLGGATKPTTPYAPGSADEQRYLKANAQFESSDNTQISHPRSGAHGLYQFLPSTWADVIAKHPDLGLTAENLYEKDPAKAREYHTKAMQAFTRDNAAIFEKQFGRKPSGGELYAMHLLGAGGGTRLVGGLDKPITEVIDPAAYKGNPFLHRFKTGREAMDYMNQRFG